MFFLRTLAMLAKVSSLTYRIAITTMFLWQLVKPSEKRKRLK